jgi:preprotein translocase SecE subunit
VARDRKRAKQRRGRRRATAAERSTTTAAERAPVAPPSQPTRADVPGALDHSSGEADEFDAALVRGAGGVTASPDSSLEDGQQDGDEDELELSEPLASGGGDGMRGGGAVAGADAGGARPAGAPVRGPGRAIAFLQASWAELQRVQWPDRRQTVQATAVVLGFVVVAGVYLGVADVVAKEIVEVVLG